jgi:hypothetical protein
VNTPPPSSTSRTTNGSGVGAPDGYKTDTSTMSTAGKNISTKAEDAKGEVDEIKPAKTQKAEFGQLAEHQTYQTDYAAAFEQFGAGATAMCDNLTAFAGQLYGSSTAYAEQEATNKTTVQQSGSGT